MKFKKILEKKGIIDSSIEERFFKTYEYMDDGEGDLNYRIRYKLKKISYLEDDIEEYIEYKNNQFRFDKTIHSPEHLGIQTIHKIMTTLLTFNVTFDDVWWSRLDNLSQEEIYYLAFAKVYVSSRIKSK